MQQSDMLYLFSEGPYCLTCRLLGSGWIDCHDRDHSALSRRRWGRDGSFVVVAVNCTPAPPTACRPGVPTAGRYADILNADSAYYGDGKVGKIGALDASEGEWMNRPENMAITIPPLEAVMLRCSRVFGNRSRPGCRLPGALPAT